MSPNFIEVSEADLTFQVHPAYMQRKERAFLDAWDFADLAPGASLLVLTKVISGQELTVVLASDTEAQLLLFKRPLGADESDTEVTRWLCEVPPAPVLGLLRTQGDQAPFFFWNSQFSFQVREPARLRYFATLNGVEVHGFQPEEPGRPSLLALHDRWVALARGLGLAA